MGKQKHLILGTQRISKGKIKEKKERGDTDGKRENSLAPPKRFLINEEKEGTTFWSLHQGSSWEFLCPFYQVGS